MIWYQNDRKIILHRLTYEIKNMWIFHQKNLEVGIQLN